MEYKSIQLLGINFLIKQKKKKTVWGHKKKANNFFFFLIFKSIRENYFMSIAYVTWTVNTLIKVGWPTNQPVTPSVQQIALDFLYKSWMVLLSEQCLWRTKHKTISSSCHIIDKIYKLEYVLIDLLRIFYQKLLKCTHSKISWWWRRNNEVVVLEASIISYGNTWRFFLEGFFFIVSKCWFLLS